MGAPNKINFWEKKSKPTTEKKKKVTPNFKKWPQDLKRPSPKKRY